MCTTSSLRFLRSSIQSPRFSSTPFFFIPFPLFHRSLPSFSLQIPFSLPHRRDAGCIVRITPCAERKRERERFANKWSSYGEPLIKADSSNTWTCLLVSQRARVPPLQPFSCPAAGISASPLYPPLRSFASATRYNKTGCNFFLREDRIFIARPLYFFLWERKNAKLCEVTSRKDVCGWILARQKVIKIRWKRGEGGTILRGEKQTWEERKETSESAEKDHKRAKGLWGTGLKPNFPERYLQKWREGSSKAQTIETGIRRDWMCEIAPCKNPDKPRINIWIVNEESFQRGWLWNGIEFSFSLPFARQAC